MEKLHDTATECHSPYEITQCYRLPDTSEHTLPSPQPDRLVLDLPTISGWRVEYAQAQGANSNWPIVATRQPGASEARTHNLAIASPTH